MYKGKHIKLNYNRVWFVDVLRLVDAMLIIILNEIEMRVRTALSFGNKNNDDLNVSIRFDTKRFVRLNRMFSLHAIMCISRSCCIEAILFRVGGRKRRDDDLSAL